jgi:hypothetical protein
MACDHREWVPGGARNQVPIAVADSRSGNPHQDLAAPGGLEIQGLKVKWLVYLMEYGSTGFHSILSFADK